MADEEERQREQRECVVRTSGMRHSRGMRQSGNRVKAATACEPEREEDTSNVQRGCAATHAIDDVEL